MEQRGGDERGREKEKWNVNTRRLQSIIGLIESVAPIHWLEDEWARDKYDRQTIRH